MLSAPSPSAGSNVQPASAIAIASWQQSLNASTIFECAVGYNGSPSITCNAGNATTGVWSTISGSCIGRFLETYGGLQVLNNFLFNSLKENLSFPNFIDNFNKVEKIHFYSINKS